MLCLYYLIHLPTKQAQVRTMRLFLAFLLLSLCGHAQKANTFTISHLIGDFYIYTTWQDIDSAPFPANGMYVVTAKGIVIIDSPWDTAQVTPILDSIEKLHHKKAIAAIATHFHADRTGALAIFQRRGIKTYSSCQTLQLCIEKNEPQAKYCFSADTIFDFGDHTLQTFYPGKGHAPDNIVLWFDKEKILYGGCFIKSCEAPGLGNLSDADTIAWPISLSNVMKRFPAAAYVIPGHQGWENKKSLEHTMKLLKQKNKK